MDPGAVYADDLGGVGGAGLAAEEAGGDKVNGSDSDGLVALVYPGEVFVVGVTVEEGDVGGLR